MAKKLVRQLLASWLLLLSSTTVFICLLLLLSQSSPLSFDLMLHQWLQAQRTPWADLVMQGITHSGDGLVSVPLMLLLGAWLWWRKAKRAAFCLWMTLLFSITIPMLLKVGLQMPRPITFGDGWSQYGFPSWHAAMALSLYGFLALILSRSLASRYTPWVYGIASIPIVLISFSRLYLGFHWLSDVLGGLMLSLVWLAIINRVYASNAEALIAVRSLLLVFVVVGSVLWCCHILI